MHREWFVYRVYLFPISSKYRIMSASQQTISSSNETTWTQSTQKYTSTAQIYLRDESTYFSETVYPINLHTLTNCYKKYDKWRKNEKATRKSHRVKHIIMKRILKLPDRQELMRVCLERRRRYMDCRHNFFVDRGIL